VRVNFRGAAHVEYCETEKLKNAGRVDKKKHQRKFFTADEEYFHIKFYVFGGDKTSGVDLEPGEYSYPFQFALPHFIPSTFEGAHGSIRYFITASLERPWKFDHETKLEFFVYSPLDLNHLENVKKPVSTTLEKRFGYFCWTTEPVKVHATVPITGYCPGQQISITGEIENHSNIEVDYISFTLRRVTNFRAKYPHSSSKQIKEEIVHSIHEPESKNGTFQQILMLPITPAIHCNNCNIIKISHEIKIECHVAGLFKVNVKKYIPITLGTFQLVNPTVFSNHNKMIPHQYYQHLEIPQLMYYSPTMPNSLALDDSLEKLKNSISTPNLNKVRKTSAPVHQNSRSPTPSTFWHLKGDPTNPVLPRKLFLQYNTKF
jgi:hypothetical protein